MANYWVQLRGHDNHLTKRVGEDWWERGKRNKSSFGSIGKNTAEDMKVSGIEFSPIVLRPERPEWRIRCKQIKP